MTQLIVRGSGEASRERAPCETVVASALPEAGIASLVSVVTLSSRRTRDGVGAGPRVAAMLAERLIGSARSRCWRTGRRALSACVAVAHDDLLVAGSANGAIHILDLRGPT